MTPFGTKNDISAYQKDDFRKLFKNLLVDKLSNMLSNMQDMINSKFFPDEITDYPEFLT